MQRIGLYLLLLQIFAFSNASDYIYHPDVGVSYKMYRTPMIWGLALYHCKNENATLFIPKDQKEVDIVMDIFRKYPTKVLKYDYIHIGLHDLFIEGEYDYINDKPMQSGYYNWKPVDSTSYNIQILHRTGILTGNTLTGVFPFICEKRRFRVMLPKPTTYINNEGGNNTKPYNTLGYVYWPNITKSYKLHIDARTWGLARTVCVSEGGNLAIIRNSEEEEILKQMFNDPKYNLTGVPEKRYAFVGFHDIFQEGFYTTVKGEDFESLKYWKWNPDIIQGTNAYNCGIFDRQTGGLADYNCAVATVFFCEKSDTNDYEW